MMAREPVPQTTQSRTGKAIHTLPTVLGNLIFPTAQPRWGGQSIVYSGGEHEGIGGHGSGEQIVAPQDPMLEAALESLADRR